MNKIVAFLSVLLIVANLNALPHPGPQEGILSMNGNVWVELSQNEKQILMVGFLLGMQTMSLSADNLMQNYKFPTYGTQYDFNNFVFDLMNLSPEKSPEQLTTSLDRVYAIEEYRKYPIWEILLIGEKKDWWD